MSGMQCFSGGQCQVSLKLQCESGSPMFLLTWPGVCRPSVCGGHHSNVPPYLT